MPNSGQIVWLASYPKSGNTWFRIVLSHLLNRNEQLNYINDIDSILGSPMAASRAWMNTMLGYDSNLLTDDEVEQARPDAYRWYSQQLTNNTYIKTHDAYSYLEDQTPLFPKEGCAGAIYFIRNPLDVAISLAHHAKCPIDWSIQMMNSPHFSIPLESNREKQLRQKLWSWSMHAESWVNNTAIPVLVIRYEDMFYQPLETFAKALSFLKLDFSNEQLEKAIADTHFSKLQDFEKRFGFKEKPAIDGQFFRKGIVGDWKETLSEEQVASVVGVHRDLMDVYGYI